MTDDPITRREFDRVIGDHDRRLAGHDGLYRDIQETREELVRFTEALKQARDQIVSGMTDREACQERCAHHREGYEKRIRALERFRWQLGGALVILVAIPSWLAVIMLFVWGE